MPVIRKLISPIFVRPEQRWFLSIPNFTSIVYAEMCSKDLSTVETDLKKLLIRNNPPST